jgi:hypothetical protein
MSYANPLLKSVDAAARSQRNPARMCLTAKQRFQVAAAFEKAAADTSLPTHTRAAFARKADWFRLLACVGEKKDRAALLASETKQAEMSLLNPFWFWGLQSHGDEGWQGYFYRATT